MSNFPTISILCPLTHLHGSHKKNSGQYFPFVPHMEHVHAVSVHVLSLS